VTDDALSSLPHGQPKDDVQMLTNIIRLALRFRGPVFALAIIVTAFGLFDVTHSTLDVFPEFAPPMAVVQTTAPGFSSEEVETLVTQPIENALGGASGIQSMRSKSLAGLSLVTVVFDSGTRVLEARQLISERLAAAAADLPAGVPPPRLLPLTTATSVVLVAAITSKTKSRMDLHDVAKWTIRPQLMSVPGVADAIAFGGLTRQLQVQIDPDKLHRLGLTMPEVVSAASRATATQGAGVIVGDNQRLEIRSQGQVTRPDELAQVPLRWTKSGVVRLGDVATVTFAPSVPVGAASVMGRPAVMLIVESQYGADTLSVTRGLERRLDALQPVLARQGIVLTKDVFRAADFITRSTHHLLVTLLIGGVLVIGVLFLFLLNLRTALISATAIPLSLLLAAMGLHLFGVTLNTMTLGGLAIALGEVVDDAIIDVENIFRRLRENRLRSKPRTALKVVLKASVEVRGAVVFATFIVILIFLPVLMLSGVAGKLFAPLGLAYIFAVIASLFVALTLTPAMSLSLLGGKALAQREPRGLVWLKRHYRRALGRVERHARGVIALLAVLVLAALVALPFLRSSFIPDLREGHFIVHVGLQPGTSLAESMRIGGRITQALHAVPGVGLVAQRAGRADDVVDPAGVQLSEFDVAVQPGSTVGQARILAGIQAALSTFPGLTTSVNTFLVERINETISGATAPVAIRVFGNNLDVIDQTAEQIARLVATLPGAASVRLDAPTGTPEIMVRLKQSVLARNGYRAADVLAAIRIAFHGSIVAQIHDGSRSMGINVALLPRARNSVNDLTRLMLPALDGV